jgi:hypothetical protein
VGELFTENVNKLIKENSLQLSNGKRSIDIVRDVTNITPILWLADKFAIPLKTRDQPRSIVTPFEAFLGYLSMFMYQSFNVMRVNEWKLRDEAMKSAESLRPVFEAHLKTQSDIKEVIIDKLVKGSAFEVGPQANHLYHMLNKSKLPIGDLVGGCIGMGAPVTGNITQQASLLIDLFLQPGYEEYKKRIMELAHMEPAKSDRELTGFVMEGMRHAGMVPGLPRVATRKVTVQDGVRGPVTIQEGHTVLIATFKAAMDPAQYPEPEKLNPHRPLEDYILLGHGL